MRNIALRLRYDGTNYHGWQEQKNAVTVAATVQKALSKICGQPIKVVGCGRTDAGVHAQTYCANFRTDSKIPAERLHLALNTLLPADIAAVQAIDAEDEFNAIQSCVKRNILIEFITRARAIPFIRIGHISYAVPLKLDAMAEAASHFVGTHDFKAGPFRWNRDKDDGPDGFWYEVEGKGPIIDLRVCADGFLYNMARAMAGTLIYVAEGKIAAQDIPQLLLTKDRRLAGPTVPPCGLYLTRIWYDGPVGVMMSDAEAVLCTKR